MKFPVLWSDLCRCTVKCSEILAHFSFFLLFQNFYLRSTILYKQYLQCSCHYATLLTIRVTYTENTITQLLTIRATYTTNNTILTLLTEHTVTYNYTVY